MANGGVAMANRIPLVLKHEDWPQADKTAWDALFVAGGRFDDTAPCVNWSDGTRQKRRQGYGQWLSFLMRNMPDVLDRPPARRIKKARVSGYIEECNARLKPRSTANLVSDLFTIAPHLDPERDWGWLALASKRLLVEANSHSLPPPLKITAAEIFQWSLGRLEEVHQADGLSAKRRAVRYRQALMIGFLISRPVRRRALLAMDTQNHVAWIADGFDIRFSRQDMKDKKDRSFLLPSALVEPMTLYLDIYRPILLAGKSSDALWITQCGDPFTPDGFTRELPNITRRHLGVPMRTHAFRHVAATSIAEFDPVHVNIIRDILGHATLDMAQKHYNRATGISACNTMQSIVDNIRKARR